VTRSVNGNGVDAAQAWIELKTDDPAAVSALVVVRTRLDAGHGLVRLRRLRLIELRGALPSGASLEERLHASTWFYNPHKETCVVRTGVSQAAPIGTDEQALLVSERDNVRREAAERWWRHAFGRRIEVREAIVWALTFEEGIDAARRAEELMCVTDYRHGLFANPHAQDCLHAVDGIPLPWLAEAVRTGRRSA
jgi:hypothetical protein